MLLARERPDARALLSPLSTRAMLGHWHAQQARIRNRSIRRFLGITGVGHSVTNAEVRFIAIPSESEGTSGKLDLHLEHARVLPAWHECRPCDHGRDS